MIYLSGKLYLQVPRQHAAISSVANYFTPLI